MEPISVFFFFTIWTTLYFLHDVRLLLISRNNFRGTINARLKALNVMIMSDEADIDATIKSSE